MSSADGPAKLGDGLRYHGGAINAARQLFPAAPLPWIDLSTGISPFPYPVGDIPASAWSRLPEASELADLEAAARVAYGADDSAEVVAAPGTQALIQWLPLLFPARSVGILGPTYGEHELCWRATSARVTRGRCLADLAACDVIVAVNPNNPDGRLLERASLVATATRLAARQGLLVVDEAFMEGVAAGASLAPAAHELPAVVLRSFGKAYGLAGLRLGFAIASPSLGLRVRAALGPWAVSGPAIDIGRRALRDRVWLAASIQRLAAATARLDEGLRSAGFEVAGGASLFRLARRSDAEHWFETLCGAGILTRPFAADPELLRFGIPRDEAEWERVEAALAAAATAQETRENRARRRKP